MTKRVMKYNPSFLTNDELIASFVVRKQELENTLDIIHQNSGDSNQHVLIVGPRGIGKTMFVLRVAAEVRRKPELSEHWYPIIYAEESYNVSNCGEFWLEAIYHLSQTTIGKRWQRTYNDLLEEKDNDRLRDRALAQLMDFADEQGKRLLLIVENLNMMLGDQVSDNEAWVLRHTLQNEKRVMLLATATSRFAEISNSGKAMFELFQTSDLRPLNENDSRILWSSITGVEIRSNRIRPIQILTGGSPRLISIIAKFSDKLCFSDLMGDIMRLVDDHTDYFKSHLDSLPVSERKAYLALAELWDPSTAKEIARLSRLGVSAASANLKRLSERGVVVVIAAKKGRTQYYQISERLYNIFYLMRHSRHPGNRVKAVVHFILDFYNLDEAVKITQGIASEAMGLTPAKRELHLYFMEAMLREPRLQNYSKQILDTFGDKPSAWSDAPENLGDMLLKHRYGDVVDSPESMVGIATRLILKKDQREEGLLLLGKAKREYPDHPLVLLAEVDFILIPNGDYVQAEQICKKVISLVPEEPFALKIYGQLLQDHFKRFDEAEQAYRKAIEINPNDAYLWILLGRLLHENLKRFNEAEQAYRKAIEINPNEAFIWVLLGQLLRNNLNRFEEAEQAYRKALEIDPNDALWWGLLGQLLHKNLNRFVEAEQAYRKSLKIEPNGAFSWGHLGLLLHENLNRFDDAEQAYRKVLKIEPRFAWPWLQLAKLLQDKLHQDQDAEQVYLEALECVEDRDGRSVIYGDLIELYFTKLKKEEAALVLAMEYIDNYPNDASVLVRLAALFFDHAGDGYISHAETWARQAMEASPNDTFINGMLANILLFQNKVSEALEYTRRYFHTPEVVKRTLQGSIKLLTQLAAIGHGKEALTILRESPSAKLLEALVVGLALDAGEDVLVAAEILEIGKDVQKRIEEKRRELNGK